MFYICGFLTLCAFIDSLFYPYKVDIPGKEIYIFDDKFNNEIKDILENKLDSKIYLVGSSSAIIISIIAHIIINHIFLKNEKNEGNNNIIRSSLVKKKNDKEKNDKEKNDIIGPLMD